MRPVTTDIARSVVCNYSCVCVGRARRYALHKRINRDAVWGKTGVSEAESARDHVHVGASWRM